MASPPSAHAPPDTAASRARRSLGLSVLDSYVGVALQIAGTVLLARLLTPEEFGLFAVAAVFSALASSVRTFGVAEFLIQQRELTPEVLRAAGGVVWIAAGSLGLLLNLAAPWVAQVYGRAELGTLLHVLSLSFFLTPVGAITLACCRREMRMGPVVTAGLAANAVSFLVAVGLAWRGLGPLSLALSVVAGSVTTALVALAFRPRHVPRWPSLKGTAEVFRFGKHVSGVFFFGQVGAGAPEMIIGKAEGVVPVAYFSRAQGLVELFNRLVLQAIWPVVLPALAEKARTPGALNAAFLRGSAYLTGAAWPVLAGMALLAWPAVRIVYGEQWVQAAPLAPVLCLAAGVSVSMHLAKDTLLALGLAKECNVLQLKVQMLRVAGILVGVAFGLEGACWGIVAATIAGAWITWRALRSATALAGADIVRALAPSVAVAGLAALPAAVLLVAAPPGEENYVRVAAAGAVAMGVAWVLAMKLTAHPLWPEVTGLARKVYRARGRTDS